MDLILVVDDEAHIARVIRGYLEREGYSVTVAEDGPAAVRVAESLRPALVILDLMLPGFDGLEVCRRLRSSSSAPILMLTARSEETDKIIGLGSGADDYLTKPFSPREMVARVKALLRRSTWQIHEPETEVIVARELEIHLRNMTVKKGAEPISLTGIEFQLLKLLASQPGRVFTKQQLLDLCWGFEFGGDDRVVVVHIANLRKKIEADPANPQYIFTARGLGYSFMR